MTDMTLAAQQTKSAASSSVSQQAKTKEAESEASFSETLETAVSEAGKITAEQEKEKQAQETGAQIAAEGIAAVSTIPIIPVMPVVVTPPIAEEAAAPIADTATVIAAAPIVDQTVTPTTQTAAPAENQSAAASSSGKTAANEAAEIPIVSVEINSGQQTSDTPSDTLQAQTAFQKSVERAQHLMRNTDGAASMRSKPLDIDVEELQKKVDSGEFLAQSQLKPTVETTQKVAVETAPQPTPSIKSDEVFGQIKAASEQNASKGSEDFTIKLRPEGLGEITVKLVSQDGRITMSLAASNTDVQKMLNSEITALREVMKPYNVEVMQVSESNETAMADLQQQLQQQSPRQQFSEHRNHSDFYAQADYQDAVQEEEPTAAIPDSALLDAYI